VKLKALLIGCGDIGAGYDLNKPNYVWSHAKAYSLTGEIELTVTDADKDKADKIAGIYQARVKEELYEKDYRNFDLISIATPTITHFDYLKDILPGSSCVIICEKPIVSSLQQANEILSIYKSSSSRVLVNYPRRFQPGYVALKKKLKNNFQHASLRGIVVKYKRGFLNNASHAVDLLEFLFEEPFDFKNLVIQKIEFDAFDYDPTLTGSCLYLDSPVSFAGICQVTYPIFEIELFYSNARIIICDSGNEIRYYYNKENGFPENEQERQFGILDQYMLPVINKALSLTKNAKNGDNFIQALKMNKKMLEIIEPLKKKNATVSH